VGLKSFSSERALAELELAPLPVFRYDTAKAFFHKGLKGRVFFGGKLAGLFQQAIGYLYGCLHMANHIILYGRMSRRGKAVVEDSRERVKHTVQGNNWSFGFEFALEPSSPS